MKKNQKIILGIVIAIIIIAAIATTIIVVTNKTTNENSPEAKKEEVENTVSSYMKLVKVDRQNNEFQFINAEAKVVTYKNYSMMTDFINGQSVVTAKDEYGDKIINTKEKEIVPAKKYDRIVQIVFENMTENFYIVEKDNDQKGILNQEGKEIIECSYDKIRRAEDQYVIEAIKKDKTVDVYILNNKSAKKVTSYQENSRTNIILKNGLVNKDEYIEINDVDNKKNQFIAIKDGTLLKETQNSATLVDGVLREIKEKGTTGKNLICDLYFYENGKEIKKLENVEIGEVTAAAQKYYVVKTAHSGKIAYDVYDNKINKVKSFSNKVYGISDLEGKVYFAEKGEDTLTLYDDSFQEIKKIEKAIPGTEFQNGKRYSYIPIKTTNEKAKYITNLYDFSGNLKIENASLSVNEQKEQMQIITYKEPKKVEIYNQKGKLIHTSEKDPGSHMSYDHKYIIILPNEDGQKDIVYELETGKKMFEFDADSYRTGFHNYLPIIQLDDGFYTMEGKQIIELQK